MRWTRWLGTMTTLTALGVAAVCVSCATNQAQKAAEDPAAKLARGKYLVTIAGCGDCHTPGGLYGAADTTRLLSGSELGWLGPWGVSYPRNLTPDPETGLGKWSEDDIVTAMRTGHRPDKTPLLPPMPWPDFASFTDEDAYAVVSYLKSIPPVSHKMPDVIPPSAKPTGAYLAFPPPPAWDAQNLPPPPAGAAGGGTH